MDWNIATSGWLPTLLSSVLSLLGLGKNKESKNNKKNLQASVSGNNYSISADTVILADDALKNGIADSSLNLKKEKLNQAIKAFVDESVDIISFNAIVHEIEDVILEELPYVIRQYLQKRESFDYTTIGCGKCEVLNKKLESMLNQISAQFPQKFDECFVKLYTSVSWEAFLDEKFVEMVSACYRNNWNDQNDFSLIVENILPKLQKTGDYNVENDCSRVLQIFWNSLNDDLRYKIAIAYYNIYNDNIWRQMKFPQKQFADKIYKELGWENIIKEMMRPILSGITSDDVEKVAEEYRLNVEWLKKQYDEIHAKRDLDLDDFART